jgi:Protein of unknown function, DUF488
MESRARTVVYAIGHGRRSLDQFISLLEGHGVRRLFDIRRMPRSATNPQFNSDVLADVLADALAACGIAYEHLAALGGFRKPRADSPNTGWHNKSFQGYGIVPWSPMPSLPGRCWWCTSLTTATQIVTTFETGPVFKGIR